MSETIIKSGTGRGLAAAVDEDNRLEVTSKSESFQEWISKEKEQAYQVRGETSLADGTVVAMHIKNTSTDKRMIITFIRHQVVGAITGTAFPNVSNYFTLGTGRAYDADGGQVIPANVNIGSSNLAQATVFAGNPTLTGTFVDGFDRWYTKENGDMNVYRKDGSLIVEPTETIEFQYVGDHTDGIIETRVSFVMEEK